MHRLIIIVFLILSLKSQCQITISNIIFYEVGDTIFQNIDNNPAHSKITPASANKQYWNFSQLKADRLKRDTIHGIKPGDTIKKYFPTAILTQPFQNFGTEYIDITSTEVRGLGLDASFLGIRFIQPYIGKRIIQFAPISLNTAKSSNSSATFAINLAAIPFLSQLIQNLIPIPGATIDSIRLNLNTKSDFIADAYGELITPFDTIEVLRVRQENKTSTKIEGKVKILIFSTWQDVSTFLPIPLPKDTTIIYHFYNNKIKDPIVSINADKNNQITSTNFKFYPKKSLDTTKIDTTSE